MLAELPQPSSFESIGWLVVCLGSVALLLNQGWAFVQNIRGPHPQPPNGQLEAARQQLELRVMELEQRREEDRVQASERRKAIYEEMRTDRQNRAQEVKDVYARIERMEKETNRMIRELPHEIIATLRNTGVIK